MLDLKNRCDGLGSQLLESYFMLPEQYLDGPGISESLYLLLPCTPWIKKQRKKIIGLCLINTLKKLDGTYNQTTKQNVYKETVSNFNQFTKDLVQQQPTFVFLFLHTRAPELTCLENLNLRPVSSCSL